MRRRYAIVTALVAAWLVVPQPAPSAAENDLDALMKRVVARRDDNWKKLQQYILDERESVDVRGAGGSALWGEQREYTWFIRDGFFVRSPVKANGVRLSAVERRKYEAEYLRRVERRERRQQGVSPADPPETAETPRDLGALIRQTREPQFISSAYFLRFRFDEGRYALVGREQLEGREVLRVEYYPSNLFPSDRPRRGRGRGTPSDPVEAEVQRLMNKVSLITLWIEPTSSQILKYTFDNVDLDFLPAQWLVRVNTLRAGMTMGEAFPDVWLPHGIDANIGLTLAIGSLNVRYQLVYSDYRRADTSSTLHVPQDR